MITWPPLADARMCTHGNMQVPGGPKDAEKAAARIEPHVVLVRDGDAQGKANAASALQQLAAGNDAIVAAIAAAGAIEPLVWRSWRSSATATLEQAQPVRWVLWRSATLPSRRRS